jgi:hypothetical protein
MKMCAENLQNYEVLFRSKIDLKQFNFHSGKLS